MIYITLSDRLIVAKPTVMGVRGGSQINEDFDSKEPLPSGFEHRNKTDTSILFNNRLNRHQTAFFVYKTI